MTKELGGVMATIFREEFRDGSKATAKYLSTIGGARSLRNMSMEDRKAGLGMAASNGVSESLHAAATDMLQVFGTIDMARVGAIGQSRFNNDYGRAHKTLVTGRKAVSEKQKNKWGILRGICRELVFGVAPITNSGI